MYSQYYYIDVDITYHVTFNNHIYIYPLKSPSPPLRIRDPNKDTFMCVTTHAAVNELKCPLLTMLSLLNYDNKKNLSITFSYYNCYQLKLENSAETIANSCLD